MATFDNDSYDPDDILKEQAPSPEEEKDNDPSDDDIDDGRDSFEEELRRSAEDFE